MNEQDVKIKIAAKLNGYIPDGVLVDTLTDEIFIMFKDLVEPYLHLNFYETLMDWCDETLRLEFQNEDME